MKYIFEFVSEYGAHALHYIDVSRMPFYARHGSDQGRNAWALRYFKMDGNHIRWKVTDFRKEGL
jgi:hypothetical protein